MTFLESLMHRKSHCLKSLKQRLMVKCVERTFIYSLQLRLEGRRYYCEKKHPQHSPQSLFLTKFLGMSVLDRRIKYHEHVENRPIPELKNVLEALENEGIQKLDIYNNLRVFELAPRVIRWRSHSLKEFGFAVDAAELIKYQYLMRETTETLHHYGVLPQTICPFENLMTNLKCSQQLQAEIIASCMKPNELPLKELRERIKKCIIVNSLGYTEDHYIKVRGLCGKSSVSDIHSLIKIYREMLDIPVEVIRNRIALLRKFPEDIMQILKISTDYKLDLSLIVSKNANILTKKPEAVALICREALDYGVTSPQIMNYPDIFRNSPKRISNALMTINKWPELSTLKLRPGFLDTIQRFTKADLHMLYLKRAGFERYNTGMLLARMTRFQKILDHEEDPELCREIVCYISTVLEVSNSEVFDGLRHQPWSTDVSVKNVKDVLSFLLAEGYTRRQILNGIALVLHPKTKVAEAYRALPNLEIVQPFADWVGNDNILHLLSYIVETKGHFFLKPLPDTESTTMSVKR